MTTIAWDGRTLAADRRVCYGNEYHTLAHPKIRRTQDGRLIGASGHGIRCNQFMDWLTDPTAAPLPEWQDDEDDAVNALEIAPGGRVYVWASHGRDEHAAGPMALGSGEQYALGAMAFGASATEAVRIASRFDISTGAPADFLTLDPGATPG